MEVFLLLRRHGVRESWRFILRNIRLIIAARADRRFDRQHAWTGGDAIQMQFDNVMKREREADDVARDILIAVRRTALHLR